MEIKISTFNSEEFCGYTQITTFFSDFSIADNFGIPAIRDTFKRAFKEWKSEYKYLTELVMVLNWKLWQHYEQSNNEYAEVYQELYEKANDYALSNLKDDELTYFFRTTD